jgi:DNA-binding NarL/FixJ family response regulator
MRGMKLSSARNDVRRILLVDGMELVRVGLAKIISAASQLIICAATGDCDDVPDLIKRHRPHLMIVEPFQQNRDGIMWIKDLAREFPQTKILVASSNSEAAYAERALRAGASGYWMKSGTADELLEAIDAVLSGELYVSPRVALLAVHKLVDRPVKGSGQVGLLSDRELHVFALIGASHGVGRIAQELNISRKTVESHCEHIKLKLGYSDAESLKRGAHVFLGPGN